ncbi:unnamed protein product [Cuscuta campestris]|uniref:Uncharacterized protein n=1 Tax=Cuscuta campestris TaxID=132261 RepID=A0A484LNI5_9ASTE|nr:unnamed protein product [Cuscuta campestris]
MVLRLAIYDAPHLKDAVQAVPVSESKHIMIVWCPEYFAVQSVLQLRLPGGENPTTLLKLLPNSFLIYESTDQFFNAVVEISDLERVFCSAATLDTVVFSQSLEVSNGVNDLGFLHARFNRPLVAVPCLGEEYSEEDHTISMKIYGMFPESQVRSADVSQDPSLNPLPPVVTFLAPVFGQVMSTLEMNAMSVVVVVHAEEAFFSAGGGGGEGEGGEPPYKLTLTGVNGLKWTRGDVRRRPVRFEIPMANFEVKPGAQLSTEVSLYKRSGEVTLVWFKLDPALTCLRGDLIHYFY